MSSQNTPRNEAAAACGPPPPGGISPRPKGTGTPPSSARRSARFSSKPAAVGAGAGPTLGSGPIVHPAVLGYPKLTPRTPRAPAPEPLHTIIRLRPPQTTLPAGLDATPIRYTIEPASLSSTQGSAAAAALAGSGSANNGGSSQTLALRALVGASLDGQTPVEETRSYEFAAVVDGDVDDVSFASNVCPKVLDQLRIGNNASVLCYGQTGSGKTYTINQLLPRLLEGIFAQCSDSDDKGCTHIVELSYLQIYNSTAYNLLATNASTSGPKGEHGEPLPKPRGFLVSEPFVVVTATTDVLQRLEDAQKRRATSAHAMNPRSSRSHTLLGLRVTRCLEGTPIQVSKITMADLAGSERLKKTGVAGEMLDEAIAINTSLSKLARCIECIADGNPNVPFRENILTLYLAQSLTDACMILVATCATETCNYNETKNTLDFATIAKKCVVTRCTNTERLTRNVTIEASMLQLVQEISTLRHRVEQLQAEAELERGRAAMLREKLATSLRDEPASSSSVLQGAGGSVAALDMSAVQERIVALEAEAHGFQQLLKAREDELRQVEAGRAMSEDIAAELSQRLRDKEEAHRMLESMLEEKDLSIEKMHERLQLAQDVLLWQEEQTNAAKERGAVLETSVAQLQDGLHKTSTDLHAARRAQLDWEGDAAASRAEAGRLQKQVVTLQRELEAAELRYLKEKNDRVAQQRAAELFRRSTPSASATAHHQQQQGQAEARLNQVLAEQGALVDSLQKRISEYDKELFEEQKAKAAAEERASAAERRAQELWQRMQPGDRRRFYASSDSTSPQAREGGAGGSGGPGLSSFDVMELRMQLRHLTSQNDDMRAQLALRDCQIRDAESELTALQEALREKELQYDTVAQLELAHSLRGDRLEQVVDDLYEELHKRITERAALERQLQEMQAQWEALDAEHKAALAEYDRLSNELDDTLHRLKSTESNNDELSARLRDAQLEKNNIALKQNTEHQRVLALEEQLRLQELRSVAVGQKRDDIAQQKRRLWRKIYNDVKHTDLVQSRLPHFPGGERLTAQGGGRERTSSNASATAAAAAAQQQQHHEEPSTNQQELVEQFSRQMRSKKLHYEVSQHFAKAHPPVSPAAVACPPAAAAAGSGPRGRVVTTTGPPPFFCGPTSSSVGMGDHPPPPPFSVAALLPPSGLSSQGTSPGGGVPHGLATNNPLIPALAHKLHFAVSVRSPSGRSPNAPVDRVSIVQRRAQQQSEHIGQQGLSRTRQLVPPLPFAQLQRPPPPFGATENS